jgi:hypothetical protein
VGAGGEKPPATRLFAVFKIPVSFAVNRYLAKFQKYSIDFIDIT